MSYNPTDLSTWKKLTEHHTTVEPLHLRDLFREDSQRGERYTLQAAGIELDYSKNRVTDETLNELMGLAREAKLPEAIKAMFEGQVINRSENRPALHIALRNRSNRAINVGGENIMDTVNATLAKMRSFAEAVHSGEFAGHTGKKLRTIVNIGIGGSFLGPKVVSDALKPYWQDGYDLKYIANIDGTDVTEVCKDLDPETTLFIVASKSFGTLETLKNAKAAREWFFQQGGKPEQVRNHFVAVSTNIEAATDFGIDQANMFPMWDWVGGRYSLWSAIGLAQSIVLGFDTFEQLLSGAHTMDEHFRTAGLEHNLPVILGMLGVWYHNFFGAESHAVLTYDEYLKDLPNHLQQVDMESNGKAVTQAGEAVDWQTGPIIWGGTGTNGQHAYHQLLHQGTRLNPADFIMPLQSHNPVADHHQWLFANFLGQQQAMLEGKTEAEVMDELKAKGLGDSEARELAPHKVIPGNRPCNAITFEKATPEVVGALIAMYEHKVFVQGVIWGVNSFDQWGVELGKVLGNSVFEALGNGETDDYDSSTANLIRKFRKANNI
ncbi:glucose-6-phosphate isomerase [Saccharospirillum salsuginis]|uniref:Glucose-6-phosphate isomerase n=1 Tax=Saccharospirillum salsuginis TaxID=418750 RepID=A0A918K4H7_9GAMM|nr:glucose-6-phosphate isomerase [Saccharospirillum salsuginis]GGX45629.1 glucose-6-phosphate isomerase [Saccharospirillum salsuginis]